MGSILLAAILLTLVTFGACAYLLYSRLKTAYLSFVLPEGENQPSPLARTMELFADMLGRTLVAQVKTFLMSQQSAEVRQQQASFIDANPINAMLPKNLKRNPLANLASIYLAKKLGALSPTGEPELAASSNGGSPKFHFGFGGK